MNITLFACKYTQLFRNCQIYPHFYVFVTNRLVLKQAGQRTGQCPTGHMDWYIGSLFRVDEPAPVIQQICSNLLEFARIFKA